MVNFGLLAAEIGLPVCGTPADFNGFRVLAALLHSSQALSQPNFAALNRGRHLCSAGRPSRWALAHILVVSVAQLCECVCVLLVKWMMPWALTTEWWRTVVVSTTCQLLMLSQLKPNQLQHRSIVWFSCSPRYSRVTFILARFLEAFAMRAAFFSTLSAELKRFSGLWTHTTPFSCFLVDCDA